MMHGCFGRSSRKNLAAAIGILLVVCIAAIIGTGYLNRERSPESTGEPVQYYRCTASLLISKLTAAEDEITESHIQGAAALYGSDDVWERTIKKANHSNDRIAVYDSSTIGQMQAMFQEYIASADFLQKVEASAGIQGAAKALAAGVSITSPRNTNIFQLELVWKTREETQPLMQALCEVFSSNIKDTFYYDYIRVLQQTPAEEMVRLSDAALSNQIMPQPISMPKRIIIGLAAGLLLGGAYFFGRELLNHRIREEKQLAAYFPEGILAEIPHGKEEDGYCTLRNVLRNGKQTARLMVFAATLDGGESARAVWEEAQALARLEQPVLLVDCNLREAPLARLAKQEGTKGVSDLGEHMPEPMNLSPMLDFLPAGNPCGDPSALLASQRFQMFLTQARDHYAYILLNGAPVASAPDTPALAGVVDGLVYVLSSDTVNESLLKKARALLTQAGMKVLGAVYFS